VDIKRSYLVRMVAEEVRAALQEFSNEDKPKKKGKGGGRPETKDAGEEPSKAGPKAGPKGPKSSPPVDEPPSEDPVAKGDGEYDTSGEDEIDADAGELPGDDEMAADDAGAEEDEADALDSDGDADQDGASGEINDQISGRTVQSISLEPESDLVPGSREIVLTFSDSPDVLRMMVDDVGNIVFSWNGKLFDYP
jgi:hypothetical protein